MISYPYRGEGDGVIEGNRDSSFSSSGLCVVGLNHRTADLSLRSAVALDVAFAKEFIAVLKGKGAKEVLALSTCSRTEIYTVGMAPQFVLSELAAFSSVGLEQILEVSYTRTQVLAINHLFTVACGLDSAAVGENEILGQLKGAFKLSEEAKSVGRILRPLLQRAFKVSKKVRTDSELGRRGLSVAAAAVRQALKHFGTHQKPTILVLGAGQIAESVCKSLAHQGIHSEVTICNRTFTKAQALAKINGFRAAESHEFPYLIKEAQLIFCASSVTKPILQADHLRDCKDPKVIVDMGVPPNVADEVRLNPAAKVLDIENLLKEVAANLAHVAEVTPKAHAIVEQEVEIYVHELEERQAAPSIDALTRRAEEIRSQNLRWALDQIPTENERERKLLEDLSIRLTRGMVSEPIQRLKYEFREPTERAVLERFFRASEE